MSRFQDKVAIVTGSSSGIGQSTAVLFAKEGAKVTITGRNQEGLKGTLDEIVKAGGNAENVNLVVGDVTTEEGQNSIINSTIEKFGKINILVNCAGAAFTDGRSTGINLGVEYYDKIFKLNVRSVIELTQKARPHLTSTKGEVVNVSSIAGCPQAHADFVYYAMSKSALDQFTRATAVELIESGIRVNSVSPGAVVTKFVSAMGVPDETSARLYKIMEEHKGCLPSRKIGQPEDIANLIAFLADRNASSYIIGQTIVADGGTSLITGITAIDVMQKAMS